MGNVFASIILYIHGIYNEKGVKGRQPWLKVENQKN